MRPHGLIAALGLAALLILGAAVGLDLPSSTLAQNGTRLSIDAIPEGDVATSISKVDTCASAEQDDTFDVDLIIENVADLLAWEIGVSYDPKVLEVRDSNSGMFQAANEGSDVVDLSEPTPDSDGRYVLQAFDAADPTSPDSGSGILARITFKAIGPGASELTLDKTDLNDDGTLDRGPLLRDVAGEVIGDEDGDTLFDGAAKGAEIRVGEPCPGQATAAAVRLSEGDGGTSVALVVGLALGGLAIVALVATAVVFFRRRARAAP
jgi:hypothetical protein